MKGTEKQVKWAEDIKARFSARVLYVYGTSDESRDVIIKALDFVNGKYDDARFWIDIETKRNYKDDKYTEAFAEMTADPEMQKLF